jgi:hypothetical protein
LLKQPVLGSAGGAGDAPVLHASAKIDPLKALREE